MPFLCFSPGWPTKAPESGLGRSSKCMCWPGWGRMWIGWASLKRHSVSHFRCSVRTTHFQTTFGHLDQGSAHFFYKGPDSKYFWLWGPYVSVKTSQLCCSSVNTSLGERWADEPGGGGRRLHVQNRLPSRAHSRSLCFRMTDFQSRRSPRLPQSLPSSSVVSLLKIL